VYAYANARVQAPVLLDRVAEAASAKVQFFDDRNLARLMLAFEASHSVSFKRCADALPALSFCFVLGGGRFHGPCCRPFFLKSVDR
jgi:hypothetical protein